MIDPKFFADIIAGLLILIGLLGSILPVLPGVALSCVGILVYKIYGDTADLGWWAVILLLIFGAITIFWSYALPIKTTKKFGGTRYGSWGAGIGLIIGIFLAPFGLLSIVITPFFGAFLGEYLKEKELRQALKSAFGTFVGFIVSSGLSIIACFVMLLFFIYDAFFYEHVIFEVNEIFGN